MITRVVKNSLLQREVTSRTAMTSTAQLFGQASPSKLSVISPGSLDSLKFVNNLRYYEDLQAEEVEIEVRAVGVNFRDLLAVLGKYNADTFGCECSGVATRIGSKCTTVHPGDRVYAAIVGRMYTYARCHEQLAVKNIDKMRYAEVAFLPITVITAHHSLVSMAMLCQEDSILIHSGPSGTGQMAT